MLLIAFVSLLSTPNVDDLLKHIFNGPGPSVVQTDTGTPDSPKTPWPPMTSPPGGDPRNGVCVTHKGTTYCAA